MRRTAIFVLALLLAGVGGAGAILIDDTGSLR